MKYLSALITAIVLFFPFSGNHVQAQTKLSGKVLDDGGNSLPGANVYLKDTYDGVTTDTSGSFSFTSLESGEQTLVVSFIGFENFEEKVSLSGQPLEFDIKMKPEYNDANTVQITAGGFGANDKNKAVVLNPLDIVTTAGANGDIFGALRALPGTQTVGEENGLFVRGGSAAETATVIDEMIVQQPFFSTVPDIPSRSQFSPFLFEGTFFSTGAYSARYGQALSSALILNSSGLPDTSSGGLNVLPGGAGGFINLKKNRTSVALSGNYFDTKAILALNPQRPDWEIEPRSGNGTLIFRHKPNQNGIIKFYSSANYSKFVVKNPDAFDPTSITRTDLGAVNLYNNASYKTILNKNWILFSGLSFSHDQDDLDLTTFQPNSQFDFDLLRQEQRTQGKLWFARNYLKNSTVWFGAEAHNTDFNNTFTFADTLVVPANYNDKYAAAFVETELYLSTKLALRAGGRVEYSSLINEYNAAPRASLALKTGKYSSVSAGYGMFYQTPTPTVGFFGQNRAYPADSIFRDYLDYEKATHYILNYTYTRKKRTLRLEGYYKEYANLLQNTVSDNLTPYRNTGDGYATGFDFFFRDQKSIKNGDYWISYSFIDTKRNYRDFPTEATPNFVASHTTSLVYKQFFSSIRSSVGATYVFATGRPFYNPNSEVEFNSQQTPSYHALNVNLSYLTSIKNNFTVIFASMNNVLGRDNIFSYRFNNQVNPATGTFDFNAVRSPAVRSFFIGMFIAFR